MDRLLVVAFILAGGSLPAGGWSFPEVVSSLRFGLGDLVLALVLLRAAPALARWLDLYAEGPDELRADALVRMLTWYLALAVLLLSSAWLIQPHWIDPARSMMAWPLIVAAACAARAWSRIRIASARQQWVKPVVILGSHDRAVRLYRDLRDHPEYGTRVLGFVDTEEETVPREEGLQRLGEPAQLEEILLHHDVAEVLMTLPIGSQYHVMQQALRICERTGTICRFRADPFQVEAVHARKTAVPNGTFVAIRPYPRGLAVRVKRIIDIAGALTGIVILLPVFVAIAIAIKATSPGPILFAQTRYGRLRRQFRMLKFRTMVVDAEARQADLELRNEADGPVFKIRDDPRVTSVGRFLRRTSLDELPQLFNVLRGEMSLVGPRPLPLRDVALFDESWLVRRFSVAPGITCLWQIWGRSTLGFDDWVTLDLQYIDRWSLGLDARILLQTLPAVIRGTGAV